LSTFSISSSGFCNRIERVNQIELPEGDATCAWATDFVSVARAEGDTLMAASRGAQDKLAALKRHLAAEDLSDSIAHVRCFAERFLAINQKNVQAQLQAEKRSAATATAARLNPPSSSKNLPLVTVRKETTNGEDVLMQFVDQAEAFFASPADPSPKGGAGSPGRRRRRRGSTIGSRRQRVNPTSSLFSSDDTLKEDEAEYLEVNIT